MRLPIPLSTVCRYLVPRHRESQDASGVARCCRYRVTAGCHAVTLLINSLPFFFFNQEHFLPGSLPPHSPAQVPSSLTRVGGEDPPQGGVGPKTRGDTPPPKKNLSPRGACGGLYKLQDAEVDCSQGFRLFYIKIYISNQILWVFAMARGALRAEGGLGGGVPAQALLQSARGRCLPRKVRG